ncbi:hypothetical protein DSO57_1025227, partial [Entomophthora muscae]
LHLVSCSSPNLDYFFRPLGLDFLSAHQVVENPYHLLLFVEYLPRRAQDLFVSGEYLVKSLTCDDLDPFLSDLILKESHGEDPVAPVPLIEESQTASWIMPMPQDHAPQCTPWLLRGMVLMELNSNSAHVNSNNVESGHVDTLLTWSLLTQKLKSTMFFC